MRRAGSGTLGAGLAALVGAAGAFAGDLPKAYEMVVSALPGKAQGAVVLRLDAEVVRGLLDLMPMGSTYREVLEARSKRFAALTGLDPMQDVVGQALVVGAPGKGGPPAALLFLQTSKNPTQLAGLMATDPMFQDMVKFQGPDKGMIGPLAFKVVPEGVWFGLGPVLAKMRTAVDPENAALLARGAQAVAGKARFVVTADVPPMGEAPPEGPGAVLAKIRDVSIAKDPDVFAIRAGCADAAAAEALKGLVQSNLDQAKAKLATPPAAETGSPFQLFNPEAINQDVQRQWVAKLFEGLSLTVQGGTTVVLESRAEMFGSPASLVMVPFLGVMSAIAIPNFVAAKERANQRACFANQKTIAGALEMYTLDKNVPTPGLDAATFKLLKEEGYLVSEITDPGVKPPTSESYFLVSNQPGQSPVVACKVHGSIDGSVPPASGGPGAPEAPPSGVNIEGLMRSIFQGMGPRRSEQPSAFTPPGPDGGIPPAHTPDADGPDEEESDGGGEPDHDHEHEGDSH